MRTISLAALTLGLFAAAQAQAPAARIKNPGDIEWKISGSLPPGAEYHLVYEDKATHAVQMLVRFASGYTLPAHSHSSDETILVVKGKLEVGLGGKSETLGAGAYVVFPAGTEHSLKAKGWGGCELLVSLNGPFDIKGLPSVR